MKQFIGGFAAGAILIGAISAKLISNADKARVTWMTPSFFDDGQNQPEAGFVSVAGTLLGEDMEGGAWLKVTCYRPSRECDMAELSSYADQPRHILYNDDTIAITSWTPHQIIAETHPDPRVCNRVRITIDRVAKKTHYYRIPQTSRNKEFCKVQTDKVMDWTLGASPHTA